MLRGNVKMNSKSEPGLSECHGLIRGDLAVEGVINKALCHIFPS